MCACTWTPQCQTHLISPCSHFGSCELLDFLWTRFRATHLTFHTQRKLVKTGLLLVSLRGSNGSTVLVALNANKFVMKREIFRIGQKKDFEEVYAPLKNVVPRVDPSDLAIGGWDCSSTNLADLLHRVDRYTCRTPHFSCTVIAQPDHQCAYSHLTRHARLKIGVHLCVPHKTPYSLRAMSYTLQHSAPCTDTPSSPLPVLRSLSRCHASRPLQRGTSPELPPLTGYEPNRIVDDYENMHFTEDDQITELEDRVEPLSYKQSFLPSTYDSAESIVTPPEADFGDEQFRALLASPLYGEVALLRRFRPEKWTEGSSCYARPIFKKRNSRVALIRRAQKFDLNWEIVDM